MASIERTATGYAVRWRLGGKRSGAPQTLTFAVPPGARPEATRKLAEAAKQLAESRGHNITRAEVFAAVVGTPTAAPTGCPTVEQWVRQYLAARRTAGDAQPDVLRKYELALEGRAVPRLGHLYLAEITPDVLADWLGWLKLQRKTNGELLSAESVRRTHAILHGCLAAAVPRWIAVNPAAKPPGARRRTAGLPKTVPHQGVFLEPWECDLILRNSPPDLADLVEVDLRTGLRLGEELVLTPRDLLLGGRRPHIKVTRALKNDGTVGPPKSAKSVRDVTVSAAAAAILDRLAAATKRLDDLLFVAPRGGRWCETNLRARRWLPTVAAAQRCPDHLPPLPQKPARGPRRKWTVDEVSTCNCPGQLRRTPRFHDLRHTHVSLLIEQGWTPKRIQTRMGHANFSITMDIYGHLWETPDGDRLDDVDRLLTGQPQRDAPTVRRARRVGGRRTAYRSRRDIVRLIADDEAC